MGHNGGTDYLPPPRTVAPHTGWRPPIVVPPAPPRELPQQDHDAIDEAERVAARFSLAVGALASAVLAVMLAVLCGQVLH